MRCYKCQAELSEHSFCTNCGADVALYKRILRLSNTFYNEGLKKAKVRDLTGAVTSLRQSLKFNKQNIKARNLLGLVYYEMGEVVAALIEWVISSNIKPKKNVAADYIEKIRSNPAKLDALNTTIKKYNQGLKYASRPDGRDLAIIQLRQVVNKNPNMLKARQLLALLWLTSGKVEAAKRELLKCQAIDVNNVTTLTYLKECEAILNPEDDRKHKKENEESVNAVRTTNEIDDIIIQPVDIKEKKGTSTVLNVLVGMAVGFAIAFFLVLPAKMQAVKAEAQDEIKTFGTQLDAKNLTINELQAKNSEQADKIKDLTENLNAYAGTEGTLASMENLLKASAVYLENPENFLEVADYISTVDEGAWTEDTSENYKSLYYALRTAIGPNVCDAYYLEGEAAYKGKQYADAIAYLSSAVSYDATDVDALYLLANSYRLDDQKELAIECFNRVIELFPDTYYSSKSVSYIASLSE